MADYVPTDWVEHETLVDAARMNKIEAGVDTAHDEAHAAQAAATAAQADADAALVDAALAQQAADSAQAAADAAATGAIPKALLDAKGDLLAASAPDAPARLPLGADGQILTADAAQALGVKWAAPAPSGADLSYDGDYAPATEYADGDIVVKDGIAYLCVGGPTTTPPDPAPWGAGRPTKESELAYAQFTANRSISATTEATAETVVTAPALSFDGQTSVVIEFFSPNPFTGPVLGAVLAFWLYEDGVSIGQLGAIVTPAASNLQTPVRLATRLTPSAGSHTYSVRASAANAVATVGAGPGGNGQVRPGYIRISAPSSPIPIIPGASLPVSYGTTLPVNPVDGQEAILVDSLTAPTYQWRFRHNAGSSSPYKWEFIGGSPYFATAGVGAAETIGPSGAWADLATVGPRMLVPRAGIYEGNAIVQCTAGGATRRVIQISLWDGTTGTSGLATATSTDAQDDYRTFSVQDVLTIPAGSDIRVRYWGSTGDQFFNRSLRVIPVRVA